MAQEPLQTIQFLTKKKQKKKCPRQWWIENTSELKKVLWQQIQGEKEAFKKRLNTFGQKSSKAIFNPNRYPLLSGSLPYHCSHYCSCDLGRLVPVSSEEAHCVLALLTNLKRGGLGDFLPAEPALKCNADPLSCWGRECWVGLWWTLRWRMH